jgi:hypothetical protein
MTTATPPDSGHRDVTTEPHAPGAAYPRAARQYGWPSRETLMSDTDAVTKFRAEEAQAEEEATRFYAARRAES